MKSGNGNRQGTPQGGVISPLLANLYMNRFLKHWRRTGRSEASLQPLATLTLDVLAMAATKPGCSTVFARPTALQQRAFDLLGVGFAV